MFQRRLLIMIGLLALLMIGGGALSAQDGTLTAGQPAAVTIAAPGAVQQLAYTLPDARAVSIQALSQDAQPTLTILRDGQIMGRSANIEGGQVVTLDVFLSGGDYIVEVGAANNTVGNIIVVVLSEIPITPSPLPLSTPVQDEVSFERSLLVYSFNALTEPAYLYFDSMLPTVGVEMRVVNQFSGRVMAQFDGEALGARVTIPAGGAGYQLEVIHGGDSSQPFSVCYTPVSAGGCGAAVVAPPAITPEVGPGAACVVTPNLPGGANIRQTTSTSAPILIGLPGGATAPVLGISPDGGWYNVLYNGVNGWASTTAVTASGDCAGLAVNNPPAIVATAVPTSTPVPPAATQDLAPPGPAPTATPVPSTSCLVTFSAPEFVYTRPSEVIDYLFDQVVAGGELILIGRWDQDPSWYKSNYGGAWWKDAPGKSGVFSGNCAGLPLVSWP